jgi:hypothetical protein
MQMQNWGKIRKGIDLGSDANQSTKVNSITIARINCPTKRVLSDASTDPIPFIIVPDDMFVIVASPNREHGIPLNLSPLTRHCCLDHPNDGGHRSPRRFSKTFCRGTIYCVLANVLENQYAMQMIGHHYELKKHV